MRSRRLGGARALIAVLACSASLAEGNLRSSYAGAPGGLDPQTLLQPLAAAWPTYSGDYSALIAAGTSLYAFALN